MKGSVVSVPTKSEAPFPYAARLSELESLRDELWHDILKHNAVKCPRLRDGLLCLDQAIAYVRLARDSGAR